MHHDALRAKLEQSFELHELLTLTQDLLGVSAETLGETTSKEAFVRKLTDFCHQQSALEALCDAASTLNPDVRESLEELVNGALNTVNLKEGTNLGPFKLHHLLGKGTTGFVYSATAVDAPTQSLRVKVLTPACEQDRGALQRFRTATLAAGTVAHPGLPENVRVGKVQGLNYVAHRHVEGRLLSSRLTNGAPLGLGDAAPIVRDLLGALGALHLRGLTHGSVKLENVLVHKTEGGADSALLLDAGTNRLAHRQAFTSRNSIFDAHSPTDIAPEVISGKPVDQRSDLFCLGLLLYRLFTGKPAFYEKTPAELALAVQQGRFARPETVLKNGWLSGELSCLIADLLDVSPGKRPTCPQALERFERLPADTPPPADLGKEELAEQLRSIEAGILDESLARRLVERTMGGGNAEATADALSRAFEAAISRDNPPMDRSIATACQAARLYRSVNLHDKALATYEKVLRLRPNEPSATDAVEELYRRTSSFEPLIESWLSAAESASSREQRASWLWKIGALYENELDDNSQALVAYTRAFCVYPQNSRYGQAVERLAAGQRSEWQAVEAACLEEAKDPQCNAQLLLHMGRWYRDYLHRPDLAESTFQSALARDSADREALEGLTALYRKERQWSALARALVARADQAASSEQAHQLRAEAARVFRERLGDNNSARELYERVVEADPTHAPSNEALAALYLAEGNYDACARLQKRQAEYFQGKERWSLLCKLGEIYAAKLQADPLAVDAYQLVLSEDPTHTRALRALDRVFERQGEFGSLLDNIALQIDVSATPKQRVQLHERAALILEQEFLDPKKAAESWEAVLELDPSSQRACDALGRLYSKLADYDAVDRVLEQHIALLSDAPDRQVKLLMQRGILLSETLRHPAKAIQCFETVATQHPTHSEALLRLAELREQQGNQDGAGNALDALAKAATSSKQSASYLTQAAGLLQSSGDFDGALSRLEQAVAIEPHDDDLLLRLAELYKERGEVSKALSSLEKRAASVHNDAQAARLHGHISRLRHEALDSEGATAAARKALTLDTTELNANLVLGDEAFDKDHFVEAAHYFARVAERTDELERSAAVHVLARLAAALSKSGKTEAASDAIERLSRLAANDAHALRLLANIAFEQGNSAQARDHYHTLTTSFSDQLSEEQLTLAKYRHAECVRRVEGDVPKQAIHLLLEASELDPTARAPLVSLAEAFCALEDWESVWDTKTRLLEVSDSAQRLEVLMELGQIACDKLEDRERAIESFTSALDEQPDDRRVLTRLVQLYGEQQDWDNLLEIVVRLADLVSEKRQKARYLMTAAMLNSRERGDLQASIRCLESVLELDPNHERAASECVALYIELDQLQEAEALLKQRVATASAKKHEAGILSAFDALGDLYQHRMDRVEDAVDAYAAAHTVEPDNLERLVTLSKLYTTDHSKYLDQAVAVRNAILALDPQNVDAYKALRKAYTAVRNPDGAWCLCQALHFLKLATPEEERFFLKMRTGKPVQVRLAPTAAAWDTLLKHRDIEPLLTRIFEVIEPVLVSQRSATLESLGYHTAAALRSDKPNTPLAQTLVYVASVFGIALPLSFENINDPGSLTFLRSHPPATSLGRGILSTGSSAQRLTFLVARHLAFYKPGLYSRQLLLTGTALKSALMGAIRVVSAGFPIPPELEEPINDTACVLRDALPATNRDELVQCVSQLLNSASGFDLTRWLAAVDYTADRGGLLMCGDLETAIESIRASTEEGSVAAVHDRVRELTLFSVSPAYLELRKQLGINLSS